MANIERDDATGVDTTGHEWDGIKELNNPLPRWWLLVLYASIIYGLGYTVFYPAWPSLSGYTKGILGYNSHAEYYTDAAAAADAQKVYTDKIAAMSVDDISKDPQLLEFSLAGGQAVFNENCAQCHGVGGQGQKGYPVLADDNWLWGGTLAQIEQTVRHGIRSEDAETRQSQMPRFGADGILTPEQVKDVAEYVVALSGGDADAAGKERGAKVFAENCVACHGQNAEGNKELGAPSLTNNIWQFTGDRAAFAAQVTSPKHGVMPAWQGRLNDDRIKMVTVYVHSLGGGQ
ncbi:cytochrome-c oxidase, cbb3-type subunit III [Dongia rigui]|uniref:Cbb3-type cytochrome c oxidase subunit n=1 Tax=Dongia rigui TaxID=940149 RepID=A0ABU5DVK8_9PROT|nr:cytochrome-c oxidase, cbb3-type subunit III [Dongia rigui]MDY0870964.1 cytochrome-c oxidase, cbb3-type subunit III [Dongia rigui]